MAAHPYIPEDVSLPGFVPMVTPFEEVLAIFFGATAMVLLLTWLLTGLSKKMTTQERWLACWFVATGTIHLVVEGYVVANKNFYKDPTGFLLSDIWKEYSKADSRYATRDAFVVQMEGFTAFVEGPGCFLIVYALFTGKPWKYIMIVLVSFGQMYGDILYFLTSWHEGFGKHCRPEPLYFWFYFVIVNGIWLVVPGLCLWHAAARINAAVAAVSKNKTA